MVADPAAASTPEITVVLPAHNEVDILANTISEVVEGLRARDLLVEVIVVENGSSDGTLTLAHELAASYPELIALTNPSADYGHALHRGLREARGAIVVNFDVDYYDLDFLDSAVARIRSGAAGIVVGTKRGTGARDDRPWPRRLVTGVFSLVLRVGFGLRASDTHGMKAMDRERVLPVAERCQLGADLFDTELVLRAERSGIRVAEIPVHVVERRPARSPIARRVPRTLVGLGRLWRALHRD